MDFELDDNQLHLQSSAADVLAKECSAAYVRAVVEDARDTSDLWRTVCSLDWPLLAVPLEDGGAGASTVELAIVLEQLGYAADPTPMLATATQFLPVVLACGTPQQRARFVGRVARDGAAGTVALAGATGTWDAGSPPVKAAPRGGDWALTGRASYVLDGDRASEVAVVAGTPGGTAVFVVPAELAQIRRMDTLDPAVHVTDLSLADVTVGEDRRLAGAGLDRAFEEAVTGLAAATVGACQRALDITLQYVRGREQFDVPIGSFQAVKHKAVDMYVAVERARALTYFAALAIAEDDPRRSIAASMAKAAAGDAQRIVFQHAIQLHGAIGYTWENDLHLYLRRAKLGELILGGSAEHRARVGRMVLACG